MTLNIEPKMEDQLTKILDQLDNIRWLVRYYGTVLAILIVICRAVKR